MNAAASTTDSYLGYLFDYYGSDKTRNGYHHTYELLLEHRRHSITDILEIGIGTLLPDAPSSMVGYAAPHYRPGGSLRAWRDWFPNANIWGIDTQHDTQFNEHRIHTRLADSTNPTQLHAALNGIAFDLIIDDGDHHPTAQLDTLTNLWPRLRPGGHYAIEDIHGEPEIRLLLALSDITGQPAAHINKTRDLMILTCPTTQP